MTNRWRKNPDWENAQYKMKFELGTPICVGPPPTIPIDMFPKIIIPHYVYTSFVNSHLDWIFLFGMDYCQKGAFGQSITFFGESNCYPIFTMFKFCSNPIYFSDDNRDHCNYINESIAAVPRDGRPIIPCRKIGCGGARMQEFCPRLYKYMMEEIAKIAYPNIEWDYGST